jgi:hypothetical protein
MADNLKGIPFGNGDEGLDYPLRARLAVLHATELESPPLALDETYVVMFAYVLGGWKALVSTSRPDGRYFEVTHNKDKGEIYVDFYVKVDQVVIQTVP